MKKGQTETVTVTAADHQGNGLAIVDNCRIHVTGAVPGDRVFICITHVSPHTPEAWATIVRTMQAGPNTIPHFCPNSNRHSGRCGGCAIGHFTPMAASDYKRQKIHNALLHCPDMPHFDWHGADRFVGYRNRSNFVPFYQGAHLKLGSFAPGTHDVAAMDGCPVLRRPLRKHIPHLESALGEHPIPLYPNKHALRYVTVRVCDRQLLVDLVITAPDPPWLKRAISRIGELPDVSGVSTTINAAPGNAIRRQPSTCHLGQLTAMEPLNPLGLEMAASTFFQLNTAVAQKMYSLAASWASNSSVVWDLYCGIGGLGLFIGNATDAAIFGADVSCEAIHLATRNSLHNDITATFDSVDLQTNIPTHFPTPDTVAVNPPRKGISTNVLEAILAKQPETIIYMSCNPTSFVRDVHSLTPAYSLNTVHGFDMLPATPHVEILARFSRKTTADTIEDPTDTD